MPLGLISKASVSLEELALVPGLCDEMCSAGFYVPKCTHRLESRWLSTIGGLLRRVWFRSHHGHSHEPWHASLTANVARITASSTLGNSMRPSPPRTAWRQAASASSWPFPAPRTRVVLFLM